MTDIVKVFIGYDHAESVAFHTLCHSIWRHSSVPVSITPLMLSSLGKIHNRPRDPNQSNDFAFIRFLVPYLCGYKGHAVFMDCDMLVTDDIAKLWNMRTFQSDEYNPAISVVKHVHQPENDIKYLGTKQTRYEKKNWSSVMLFNNAECKALTPALVNTANGLHLHQFKWLEGDYRIGDLPLEWNYLADYYAPRPPEAVSNIHYTEGGPYFNDYAGCDFADVWFAEKEDMLHCSQVIPEIKAG